MPTPAIPTGGSAASADGEPTPDAAVIKYIGSKRRLVPALGVLAEASRARTALDLFAGTTRVAQAWKQLGLVVTAVDAARCSHVLARCYIEADPWADPGLLDQVGREIERLNALPGCPGYVTATFCEQARFFRPENGARIDAIRDAIEADHAGGPLWPILLTSLLEAADRVDSTTGVQMAYLKEWAPRALQPLTLRVPELLAGPGHAVRGDAVALAGSSELGRFDLAYLDPPYNQHRYDSNYHVWETIVAWDAPSHYGIACKREDLRDPATRSAFNGRRTMPAALAGVVAALDAEVVVLSYNNEAWLTFDELSELCATRSHVEVLAFDSPRYVGARIGIHDPSGRRVGTVSHLRNTEYVVVAGERATVRTMVRAVERAGLGVAVDEPVAVSL